MGLEKRKTLGRGTGERQGGKGGGDARDEHERDVA